MSARRAVLALESCLKLALAVTLLSQSDVLSTDSSDEQPFGHEGHRCARFSTALQWNEGNEAGPHAGMRFPAGEVCAYFSRTARRGKSSRAASGQ